MIRLAAITQPLSVALTPTLKMSIAVTQPLTQQLTNTMLSTAPRIAPAPLYTLPGTNPTPMPTPPPSSPDSPPVGAFLPYFPASAGADVPAAAIDPAPPQAVAVAPAAWDTEKRLMGVPLKNWLIGAGVIGGSIVLLRILR